MRRITHLVLHTSGTQRQGKPLYPSAAQMDAAHRRLGWDQIGYHFVIGPDGSMEIGRPIEQPGAHVRGMNATTIGICVTGHGDLAPWTAQQWEAALQLCQKLLSAHRLEERFKGHPKTVLGHRECGEVAGVPKPRKSCPGRLVPLDDFRRDLRTRLG